MIAIFRNFDMLILLGHGGSVLKKKDKKMKQIIMSAKFDNGH
jgi:hypothetical protein